MKAKILRKIEPDGMCWFYVKAIMPTGEENLIHCLQFKLDEPKDSIWNEEKEFARALAIAHRLENAPVKAETIVYETPIQTEVEISEDDEDIDISHLANKAHELSEGMER